MLIVDSNREGSARLAALLRRSSHEALTAATHDEGMARLADEAVDVLLVSIAAPVAEGVGFVRAARQAAPHLRIVALSGESADHAAATGLKAAQAVGADAILYKPFTDHTLLNALRG